MILDFILSDSYEGNEIVSYREDIDGFKSELDSGMFLSPREAYEELISYSLSVK